MGMILLTMSASAAEYASLKHDQINLRSGPGERYPIMWVYQEKHYPVEVLGNFEIWRQIRDKEGTVGWVHQNMLSRKNTAIVIKDVSILYKYASKSQPIARVEKNVIVRVMKKDKDWVKIETHKIKGWMKKEELWGVNDE